MILGDGYSRNSADRDQLLEQRTKDLQGISGQTRGFDVNEFLSDWEPLDGRPLPWALGDDTIPVPPRRKNQSNFAFQPSTGRSGPMTSSEVFLGTSVGLPDLSVDVRVPTIAQVFASTGSTVKLSVLYVPDYVPISTRLARQTEVWTTERFSTSRSR